MTKTQQIHALNIYCLKQLACSKASHYVIRGTDRQSPQEQEPLSQIVLKTMLHTFVLAF